MNDSSSTSPMYKVTTEKMTRDMNFVGVVTIIMGAIECLTIVGAIIGIPLIIAGLRLREAVSSYRLYADTNDASILERAFEKQGKYFLIQKILIIIGIALVVLYIIAIIIFGVAFFTGSGMPDNYDYY